MALQEANAGKEAGRGAYLTLRIVEGIIPSSRLSRRSVTENARFIMNNQQSSWLKSTQLKRCDFSFNSSSPQPAHITALGLASPSACLFPTETVMTAAVLTAAAVAPKVCSD